ncbi:hypothetical protein WA026_003478 [Henosepilachna vigintioctopunctata]|uniref:Uncharacterized protein n=1 Tax=Henosepilachna vigintioctopunctata TaxID=420089 RepID=A0AAW1THK3_9CUCU
MMERFEQQNIVVNEGSSMQFMSDQIYFTDEPSNFEDVHTSEINPSNNDSNEVTDHEEMPQSGSSGRNEEQVTTYLQMIWNGAGSEFEDYFMAIRGTFLTDQNESSSQNATESPPPVYEIDDSDDEDVVFVGAYPVENHEAQNGASTSIEHPKAVPKEEKQPRRNPSRKARNSKYGRKSNDENIYEEDFCMLDSTEEESSADESAPTSSSTVEEGAQNLSAKDMKKWPVNGLHERPEYNVITEKIEQFDYTIREIQDTVKKPKRDDSKKPKPRKKRPVKKYTPKKRATKSRVNKAEASKVNLDNTVKDLINHNYRILPDLVRSFKQRSQISESIALSCENDENSSSACNSTAQHEENPINYETLFSHQSRFFALVNKVSYQDAFIPLVNNSEGRNS